MPKFFYTLGPGLQGEGDYPVSALGPRTKNFYPDGEGYLVNYPGKTDWFKRGSIEPQVGTPPALDGTLITRIHVFRDVLGVEHIVFVRGSQLCESVGNGFRVLYTLSGRSYSGLYYPDMFIFQSKLIIVNFGDQPLVWDGVESVDPLGVHEAPLPPDCRVGQAPWTLNYILSPTDPHSLTGHGPFKLKCYWWTGSTPANGAGDNLSVDGSKLVPGIYQKVIQYADKYGNKGPVSPPSTFLRCQSNTPQPAAGAGDYTDTPEWYNPEFPSMDWSPPRMESHIMKTIVGSTLNLNEDGGAGVQGVYFLEHEQQYTTPCRLTCQLSDGVMAEAGEIDTEVSGPPSCGQGSTWGGRIILWDLEDPYRFLFSDLDYFGQYRSINEHKAHSIGKSAVSLGDRVLLVSSSSVDVLYDNNGSLALLEQDYSVGSNHGKSLIDVGGAVFGLWTQGFGFYSQKGFEKATSPYFLQGSYVDNQFYVQRAILYRGMYLLSCRIGMDGDGPNTVLIYHLESRQWYQIEETVYDFAIYRDSLLVCGASIYEMFKGTHPAASFLEVYRLSMQGAPPTVESSIEMLRLYLEASSDGEAQVEIESSFHMDISEPSEPFGLIQSGTTKYRSTQIVPRWRTEFLYATEPKWSAPGDIFVQPRTKAQTSGWYHTLYMTFPSDHPIRLRGAAVSFSESGEAWPS